MTDLLLTNAALLDLDTGALHEGSSVRVEGDRIVDVAVNRTLTTDAGIRRVDADGLTLVPGLIDAHVHAGLTTLDLGALAHRAPTRIGIEAKSVLEGMLRRGFTTVRDAGGLDRGMQESLDAGLVQGPRVFRSGRVLSPDRWSRRHAPVEQRAAPVCLSHRKHPVRPHLCRRWLWNRILRQCPDGASAGRLHLCLRVQALP
jgi:imidazolonepropionase-like amidohydrolase